MNESMPHRHITGDQVEFGYRALLGNKSFLAFGGLGFVTFMTLPGSAALAGVPLMTTASVMLKRTLDAYRKTMVVLLNDPRKRGGAGPAQELAHEVVGLCAYYGVKAAFKEFFGDHWKEEFRKLKFTKLAKPLADEDL